MSRLNDAFALLEDRGDQLGPDRMLERVDATLDSEGIVQLTQRRPLTARGPVVAGITAIAVLIIGLLLFWSWQPANDVADDVVDTGGSISWFEVPEIGGSSCRDVCDVEAVGFGPGGFVAVGLHDLGGVGITHSGDGREWTNAASIPAGRMRDVSQLVADEETWILNGWSIEGGARSWVSVDGSTWEALTLPSSFEAHDLGQWTMTSGGPIAFVPDGSIWQLTSEHEFVEIEPVGIGRFAFIYGHPDSDVLVSDAFRNVAVSPDGRQWQPAPLPGERDSLLVSIWWDGDAWLGIADGPDGYSPVRLTESATWEPADDAFPFETGFPGSSVTTDGAELVVVPKDGFQFEVWGRVGEQPWKLQDPVSPLVAVGNIDGRIVGVYGGGFGNPAASARTTTTPATESSATPPLVDVADPVAAALIEEILSDGKVTIDEFKHAVAGFAECLEAEGFVVNEWWVNPDGTFSISTTPIFEETACEHSYLDPLPPISGMDEQP